MLLLAALLGVGACSSTPAGGGAGASATETSDAVAQLASFRPVPLGADCPDAIEVVFQFDKSYAGEKLVARMTGPSLPPEWTTSVPAGGRVQQDFPLSAWGAWALTDVKVGGRHLAFTANASTRCLSPVPSTLLWEFPAVPAPGCTKNLTLTVQFNSQPNPFTYVAPGTPFTIGLQGPGLPAAFQSTQPSDGSAVVQVYPVTGPGTWTITSVTVDGKPPRPESSQASIVNC